MTPIKNFINQSSANGQNINAKALFEKMLHYTSVALKEFKTLQIYLKDEYRWTLLNWIKST